MPKRLLYATLSTRLVLFVGIPAALFLIAILFWAALKSHRQTMEQTRASAMDLAHVHAARLDQILGEAARIPELHAQVIESGALKTPAELQSYLTNSVKRNPDIYGSCLAFEPHTFVADREFFAPYAYWKTDHVESTDIGTPEYNPFRWEWYARPKQENRALWTEPYFDEGGGNALMTTRSVPFYKAGSQRRKEDFLGIATIDISIDQLVTDLKAIRVAETGYAFLVSPAGRFLAYPDSSKILKGMIQEENATLASAMMTGAEGFLRTHEPWKHREAWIAHMPVQNGGFTLAIVYPQDEIMRTANRLVAELVGVGLFGLAALFVMLFFVARSVTMPLTQLATITQKIADGDLNQHLNQKTNIREVRELSSSFDKMTRDLRMRMEELRYTTILKERMAGELNAARRIQMAMLPKEWSEFGALPRQVDVSLHAVIQPAREIGGDFYDYRFLDDKRLAILIGDVSGKGIPAALFMAMTTTLFKGFAAPERTAAAIMARVNDALCEEAQTGMFVTLVYGVLNVRTGSLELCNAGHPPPLLLDNQGVVSPLQGLRNPALGLLKGVDFRSTHFELKPDERLLLYTDGVTEATNSQRELFSSERLEALFRDCRGMTAEAITEAIINNVRAHAGNDEPSDDLTVLALKMAGNADPSI